MARLNPALPRLRRRLKYSKAALLFFRYRYLIGFTVFGLVSILVEIALAIKLLPASWPASMRTLVSFAVGLTVSFLLNAFFNLRVPSRYLLSTFQRFAAVSVASFALNMVALRHIQAELGTGYAVSRLACAGSLFLLAYVVHRKLTFRLDRNFGIAVYASPIEHVRRIFLKVGRNCDHIHIDLVDSTVNAGATVDLNKIQLARQLWPNVPFALHLMTRRPDRWLEQTLEQADWFLFSLARDVELEPLMARCQLAGKKVGIVWHLSDPLEEIYSFLPHVDFVMVLGIAQPGFSGQSISTKALEVIHMLDRLRHHYRYELMFDGSVNAQTVAAIPAKYVVAASSVLKSQQPARVIYTLKTGGRHERKTA